jgi:hypothetical protein
MICAYYLLFTIFFFLLLTQSKIFLSKLRNIRRNGDLFGLSMIESGNRGLIDIWYLNKTENIQPILNQFFLKKALLCILNFEVMAKLMDY